MIVKVGSVTVETYAENSNIMEFYLDGVHRLEDSFP
jgi:hypothetical protein